MGQQQDFSDPCEIDLSHLLVGSEGTLAYFKSLKLKLARLPKHKVLGVVNFASFYKAMDATQHLVKLDPVAVELIDTNGVKSALTVTVWIAEGAEVHPFPLVTV